MIGMEKQLAIIVNKNTGTVRFSASEPFTSLELRLIARAIKTNMQAIALRSQRKKEKSDESENTVSK